MGVSRAEIGLTIDKRAISPSWICRGGEQGDEIGAPDCGFTQPGCEFAWPGCRETPPTGGSSRPHYRPFYMEGGTIPPHWSAARPACRRIPHRCKAGSPTDGCG
jgi:hypothetical protein